ncbi:ankyrin repeat-containing domain protein [Aspergillus pseudoustus]|uniref:Ankyrin repeat-containing domain protein n=1 Tax=Aspergillus pseudoustus TaxID=1810923 RepID=A0ABR4K655_9EURO
MRIFDLQLEMFHAILAQTLPTYHSSHITQMQLVNIYGYLCYRSLAPDAHVYYPIRTVRQATDWIVSQLSAEDHRKEICRALFCSALSRRPQTSGWRLLSDSLYGVSIARIAVSDQKTGLSQESDALVHRFSAAACIGDLALVQSLLDEGADVDGKSGVFDTALVNAARWGHLPVVQLLLENGADLQRDVIHGVGGKTSDDLDADIDFVSWFIWTLEECHTLEAAAIGGHEDILSLLLEPRLNLSRSSCTFFHALIGAAEGGSINVLRMLMDSANFDAIGTILKKMVLDSAMKRATSAGHLECMELLIDAGAPLSYNGTAEGDHAPPSTPLGAAKTRPLNCCWSEEQISTCRSVCGVTL